MRPNAWDLMDGGYHALSPDRLRHDGVRPHGRGLWPGGRVDHALLGVAITGTADPGSRTSWRGPQGRFIAEQPRLAEGSWHPSVSRRRRKQYRGNYTHMGAGHAEAVPDLGI